MSFTQSKFINDRMIKLVTSKDNSVEISYTMNKNFTARRIIEEYVPNPSPNACLIFGETLIEPNEKFSKIE